MQHARGTDHIRCTDQQVVEPQETAGQVKLQLQTCRLYASTMAPSPGENHRSMNGWALAFLSPEKKNPVYRSLVATNSCWPMGTADPSDCKWDRTAGFLILPGTDPDDCLHTCDIY